MVLSGLEEGENIPIPSLTRTITPGYLAALTASPSILCDLCKQYFREYDRNCNGVMECSELIALARDVEQSLAVPISSSENELKSYIITISRQGHDSLSLEEFCQWFPSLLGVEPLSPHDIERYVSPMNSESRLESVELSHCGETVPPGINIPIPSLLRTITPGYMAALMSSPKVLRKLCSQYFTKYDSNSKHILDLNQLARLCEDLQNSLAVPIGLEPEELKHSIKAFSESGQCSLNLDEFCRWFPSILGLEPLSPQDVQDFKEFYEGSQHE